MSGLLKCTYVLLVFSLISLPFSFSITTIGQQNQKDNDEAAVKTDIETLRNLIRQKDLEKLTDFQRVIDDHWKTAPEIRVMLMSEMCKALNSEDFGDARSTSYARNCAKRILIVENDMSVDQEYDMIKILQEIEEYRLGVAPADAWAADREQRVAFLIRFSKRVARAYDPGFDIRDAKNRPVGNVCPPSVNYPCGIRPEDIKDLTVRDAYVAAIAKNADKARRFNLQMQLKGLLPSLPHFIDRFIIEMYSQPPADKVHLNQALDQLGVFGDRRAAIAKSVGAAIQRP